MLFILLYLSISQIYLYATEPNQLSPEEFARRALLISEKLASGELKILAEKQFMNQSQKFPNPQVSFNYGQRRIGTQIGPQYQLTFSQPFLYPGKRRLRKGLHLKKKRNSTRRFKQNKSKPLL